MKLFVKMFVVLAVLLLTANVRAQMPQQLSDPAVRVGKLPNGLRLKLMNLFLLKIWLGVMMTKHWSLK